MPASPSTGGLSGLPRYAAGGPPVAPWFARYEAREIYHPGGLLNSSTAGRTDRLPISVAADSYVVPADVVSGLGQGSTLAGAKILQATLRTGPYGTSLPRGGRGGVGLPRPPRPFTYARGGATPDKAVPILAAGGEFVVSPEDVARLGGGDVRKGHKILDELVKRVRQHTMKFLKSAPKPKK